MSDKHENRDTRKARMNSASRKEDALGEHLQIIPFNSVDLDNLICLRS